MTCRICNYALNDEVLVVKEKMFGTNELFEYRACSVCGCIQIKSVPPVLNKYYPDNYYSFENQSGIKFKNLIKQKVRNFLSFIEGDFHREPYFTGFGIKYSDKNSSILDIGCGNGKLLRALRSYGFMNLTGTDPFIGNGLYLKGLKLLKLDLENLDGKYDLIMSNHSLEHMPDPHSFFANVVRLLDHKGRLILRIPVYPNYITDKYGLDWIQFDAPRHLFTFTLKSIRFLCNKHGLFIEDLKFDSAPWALAATKYCQNGKTLKEFEQNISVTEEQVKACREANEKGYGDSVCLAIVKQNPDRYN